MVAKFWISSLTFNDGTSVELEENAVVVFVGPNNGGKSSALTEVYECQKSGQGFLVLGADGIEVRKEGSADELKEYLRSIGSDDQTVPNQYQFKGTRINEGNLQAEWAGSNPVRSLTPFFMQPLHAHDRLTAVKPRESHDVGLQFPTCALHRLHDQPEKEALLSAAVEEAFEQRLAIWRGGGKMVRAFFGQIPDPGNMLHSTGYQRQLLGIPKLEDQGDGVKSFVGTLLEATVVHQFITLIDEPEVFLHPPQARMLGQVLTRDKPENQQLFLATHSGDFLRGVLDKPPEHLHVLRIQREGDMNPVRRLSPAQVRDFWDAPVLKYSNLLDGLFHRTVVLCEDEADCWFYSAMLDDWLEATKSSRPDLMFVGVGGKSSFAKTALPLTAVGVEVKVLADFDVLNNEETVQGIVEALHGDWETYRKDWGILRAAVENGPTSLEKKDALAAVTAILDSGSEPAVSKGMAKKLRKAVSVPSPWRRTKELGLAGVPPGDASAAAERLLEALEQIGLYPAPVGEMEGWIRTVGNHGLPWVTEVLENKSDHAAALLAPREFVRKVAGLNALNALNA